MQGLGDAAAHRGIICDAGMTTYLLSHWAGERASGPQLPLEVAVRRLTHDPARLYDLHDRGVLAPGMQADVTSSTSSTFACSTRSARAWSSRERHRSWRLESVASAG